MGNILAILDLAILMRRDFWRRNDLTIKVDGELVSKAIHRYYITCIEAHSALNVRKS